MSTKERAPERERFTQTTSHKARELAVSEQTVREMANKGELECVRTSTGARLFRPGDGRPRT